MKILHVNTYDTGGAANAAIRLHKAMLSVGLDSNILFLHQSNDSLENSYLFKPKPLVNQSIIHRIINKLKRDFLPKRLTIQEQQWKKLENQPKGYEMFSFNKTDVDILDVDIYKQADIIHLHWVAGFIDFSFFKKNKKPVIWTLHDMNPFTGGCHYSAGCQKYENRCVQCPQLKGTVNNNNSLISQNYKAKALKKSSFIVTAPSNWLRDCAAKSTLFKNQQYYSIANTLDLSIFKIRDQALCREELGLPIDKQIGLFISDNVQNTRKGFAYLLAVLSKIQNVHMCVIGENEPELTNVSNISFLGKINDELRMAKLYSASDVFILPSIEDNLPNVMLESMACGRPVIAFPIGGMKEIITTGVNGILADEVSEYGFEIALQSFSNNMFNFDEIKIREFAETHFAPQKQSDKYLELYKQMI